MHLFKEKYLAPYGIQISKLDDSAAISVAETLYSIPKGLSKGDVVKIIVAIPQKDRQRLVRVNGNKARRSVLMLKSYNPEEDDGSQEWLDAYAKKEWKRFMGAVMGRRKYADGDARLALDAYCRKSGMI